MSKVEITQADREAAAIYWADQYGPESAGYRDILEGEVDSWDLVQMFAKHRLNSFGRAPSLPSAEVIAGEEDFLDQLRRVNTERYIAWVGEGEDAGIMFDATELGGEVGELLNVIKKLEREERGWRGSRADPQDFADECADVLICLDKLARRRNVDLAAATVAKFNATSDKVGLPHKLVIPAKDDRNVQG